MGRGLKLLIVLALLGGVGHYGYGKYMATAATQAGFGGHGGAGGPPPASVSVAEITSRDVQLWHEFSGRLVAVDSAEIRPRVSGTIDAIKFKEGAWVEKGQPLFVIDPKPYVAALQSAQAQASFAQAELNRAKTLLARKVMPARDYDLRKNNAAVAYAALTQAKLNMDYTTIKAPIAGRISRAEITVGNLVDAGGQAPVLTTIVANKPIYADFDIDEEVYLHYLKVAGDDAEKLRTIPVGLSLSGETATNHVGWVHAFDNKLNAQSGTLRVRAIFQNDDGALIPGLFARVQLGDAEKKQVVLINDKAVNTDQSIKFVWVVGSDNKVAYRPVTLGGMHEGLRIISDGLKVGEKIVIGGTQRVMMPDQVIVPNIVPMSGEPAPDAAPIEGQ